MNEKYAEEVDALHDFFAEAKAYSEGVHRESNLRFEEMKGLFFTGTKKLFIQVNEATEILEAIAFSKKFGLQMVLVGGRESWRVAEQLKAHNIPVILYSTHELPPRQDDDIDITFKLPALLQQAGVEFCISMGGSWEQRSLPFVAGSAAAYGLSKEQAIAAVTSSPAKILGLEKSLGTLETGKDATLIISSGDVLDMRTSNIEYAFISGRQIDLDNLHKMLYRKFKQKY